VRATASVAVSMTLTLPACLFATQTMPFGASASVRGPVPTATSASLARVTASNTVTESLSWLTTHKRLLPLVRRSTTMLVDADGLFAVVGR
jgi:hypothetical protein